MSELLKEAQRQLKIKQVRLKNALVELGDDIEFFELEKKSTKVQNFNTPIGFKVFEVKNNEDQKIVNVYFFSYQVGVRMILNDGKDTDDKEVEPEVLLEIKASFSAEYSSDNKLNESQLNEFMDNNLGYNIWPYWREFVHSNCLRLGVRPLEVPFYTFQGSQDK